VKKAQWYIDKQLGGIQPAPVILGLIDQLSSGYTSQDMSLWSADPLEELTVLPQIPSLHLREGNGQGMKQDGGGGKGRGENGWDGRGGGRVVRLVGEGGGRKGARGVKGRGGEGKGKEGEGKDDRTPRFQNVDVPMLLWNLC